MPLLKRKQYLLQGRSKTLLPSQKVFHIPFTGEVFEEYSDYLSHLHSYRERVWTCRFTGKQGLTYEEALAQRSISDVPRPIQELVANLVHHREGKLDDIAAEAYQQVSVRFFAGEPVVAFVGGQKISSVILSETAPDKYLAKADDGEQTLTLDKQQISRKKLVSKETVKRVLSGIAARDRNKKWCVEETLAKSLGLDPPYRPDAQFSIPAETPAATGKRKPEAEGTSPARAKKVKPAVRRYPIEDSLLTQEEIGDLPAAPAPKPDALPLSEESLGEALQVWSFCRMFAPAIKLSPFSLDDLITAFYHPSPLTLTIELHTRLLSAAGRDVKSIPWAPALKAVLRADPTFGQSELLGRFNAGGYGRLSAQDRCQVAAYLIKLVACTELIHNAVDTNITKLEDAKKSARDSETQAKARIKELETKNATAKQMAAIKEAKEEEESAKAKRADTLEKEIQKRLIRVEPIGVDRRGTEYWSFQGDSRLFVKQPPQHWGALTTPEEQAQLFESLCVKGIKEKALKHALEELPPVLVPEAVIRAVSSSTRRSARVVDKQEPFYYVNSYK